jgi:long-subunit fatty acid transport protein
LSNITAPFSDAVFGATYSTDAETELKQPESLLIGYAYQPGQWTFSIDGEWIGFGSIKETHLTYAETDATRLLVLNDSRANPIKRDWRNTWNLGMGANYKFNEKWQGRFGYFHHASVVPTANWDPSIPDSSKNGYTLGGGYNLPSFTLDFIYNYLEFSKRNITNSVAGGTANGTYETKAHIFGLTATHRFGGEI